MVHVRLTDQRLYLCTIGTHMNMKITNNLLETKLCGERLIIKCDDKIDRDI